MVWWLTACSSSPKSFYLLTPSEAPPARGGLAVGVGPISFPAYADRPHLVLQEGEHRFVIAESHRWAGDVTDNFTRVLAAEVGRALNSGRVRAYPWESDAGLQYQLTVDVLHFHGTTDGDAVLEVAWRAYALPERRQTHARTWSDREPLARDGYDALVAAQSRLISRLAQDIATELK